MKYKYKYDYSRNIHKFLSEDTYFIFMSGYLGAIWYVTTDMIVEIMNSFIYRELEDDKIYRELEDDNEE